MYRCTTHFCGCEYPISLKSAGEYLALAIGAVIIKYEISSYKSLILPPILSLFTFMETESFSALRCIVTKAAF